MTLRYSRTRVVLVYLATAMVSLLAFVLADRLWQADLRVPFSYAWYGDAIEPQLKFLLDGGWFFEPHLATPFGLPTQEFTQLNTLKWAIRGALVIMTGSPFIGQNLFVLLDPILASITFLYAARRLGIGFVAAIPCAVLYGNLYMLYWRVIASHGLQSAYWLTPLACLALLQIAGGTRLSRSFDSVVLLGTALLVGLESHYEVAFAGSLLILALLIACVQGRSIKPIMTACTFVAVMGLGFLINAAPMIQWLATHHGHIYHYERTAVEVYLYALSIGQMILPNPDHRILKLASIRQHFDSIFPPLYTENRAATLGFIGDVGLCLLGLTLMAPRRWHFPRVIEHSAFLAYWAMLIATIGSVCAIFNIFVNPDVHAWNRISTWIAFFCLIAVAYVLEQIWIWMRVSRKQLAYFGLAALIVILGVLDQSPAHTPPYEASRLQAAADVVWTENIAKQVPAGGAILELPYTDDVDSLLARLEQVPYMYSRDLRWSVGGYRETSAAHFESWLANLPARSMVAAALLSGFSGVLIYHGPYPDSGRKLIAQLRSILRVEPASSSDGTQTFFRLTDLIAAAHAVDDAVGTPRGVNEAVGLSEQNAAVQAQRLGPIERAVARYP